jgi:putative ABC transport system substrate-binding protein
MNLAADDPEGQARHATFVQGLQQSGWSAGRNVRIDTRWGTSEADRRRYAAELVALAPDVILASNSQATLALQAATSTVPIVFANVTRSRRRRLCRESRAAGRQCHRFYFV